MLYVDRDNTELLELILHGNPLKLITGPFLYSESLVHLQLANCHLQYLSPHSFVYTSHLQKLNLSMNPLKIIIPGVFDPLNSLTHLILNNCNIYNISSIAFSKLIHLTVLELAGNSLKNHVDWTSILGNLSRLEHFNLRKSEISNLPDNVFINNTHLKELVLAENDLSNLNIAAIIGHSLINLNHLDLSYCNLNVRLPKFIFANARNLRFLNLSGNRLPTTPKKYRKPYFINTFIFFFITFYVILPRRR